MNRDTPTRAAFLQAAMLEYRYAVADVSKLTPTPADARPVFVLEAAELRRRAGDGDAQAAAELVRRDRRAELFRAVELAAMDPAGPLEVREPSTSLAPPVAAPALREVPKPAALREVPKPSTSTAAAMLREWREGRGLSQAAAAELIGVKRAAWGMYEQGRSKVDPDLRPKLAEVTGIPVDAWKD